MVQHLDLEKIRQTVPLQRLGTVDDVAGAVEVRGAACKASARN